MDNGYWIMDNGILMRMGFHQPTVVISNYLEKDRTFESKNIVIFTASSDPKIKQELGASGAKEIFKKPCSLDDLKALAERYRGNT